MRTHVFAFLLLLLQMREGKSADPAETGTPRLLGLSVDTRVKQVPSELKEQPGDFFHRLTSMSARRLEDRLFDTVNPFRIMVHELMHPDRNAFPVSMGHIASSLKFSLREIAVDTELVQSSRDWSKDFFEGMIGNTEEEEVTISESPQPQYSDETWREKIRGKKIKWGVRAFRWPDPYVYVSGQLGSHDRKEIFLWHLRYYTKEFESQRAEALFSLRLPDKFFLSTGVLYSSGDDDRDLGRVYVGTFRLEKWFPEKRGAIFAGMEIYKKMSLVTGCFYSY